MYIHIIVRILVYRSEYLYIGQFNKGKIFGYIWAYWTHGNCVYFIVVCIELCSIYDFKIDLIILSYNKDI